MAAIGALVVGCNPDTSLSGDACDHILALGKSESNEAGAKAIIERVVSRVESSVVKGAGSEPVKIRASAPRDRCTEAFGNLKSVMVFGQYQRMLGCYEAAPTLEAADGCP
jgi:hypothetical protein